MVKFQATTTLHEKAVQKVAEKGAPKRRRKPGPLNRPRTSPVVRKHWSDKLDKLLVRYVEQNHIHHSKIEVLSPTEILITR